MFYCSLNVEFCYNLEHRYEFKNNHGDWVTTVKPDLGPGISEAMGEAVRTSAENIDICQSVKTELRAALSALLGVPFLPLRLNFSKQKICSSKLITSFARNLLITLLDVLLLAKRNVVILFTKERHRSFTNHILPGLWHPCYPYSSWSSTKATDGSIGIGSFSCPGF